MTVFPRPPTGTWRIDTTSDHMLKRYEESIESCWRHWNRTPSIIPSRIIGPTASSRIECEAGYGGALGDFLGTMQMMNDDGPWSSYYQKDDHLGWSSHPNVRGVNFSNIPLARFVETAIRWVILFCAVNQALTTEP